jgi:hypothetical protein
MTSLSPKKKIMMSLLIACSLRRTYFEIVSESLNSSFAGLFIVFGYLLVFMTTIDFF